MDGMRMANNVTELRPKAGGETEKITINLGFVDLGQIDLLVAEGFYGNRSDFIRTAIRNQLAAQGDSEMWNIQLSDKVTAPVIRQTIKRGHGNM